MISPSVVLVSFRQVHLEGHACSAVIVPVHTPHGKAVLESSYVWSVPPPVRRRPAVGVVSYNWYTS